MAVAIRLSRFGKKNDAFYRVVVTNKRSKRDGKCLENVGTFEPALDAKGIKLNKERISYWITKGAKPTTIVKELISQQQ